MKRTGFSRKAPTHVARDPDRVRSTPTATPGAWRAPQPVGDAPAAPVHKEEPVRSEAYRRLVAKLPCAHCGIAGYTQHAHENDGKGKGLKVDDRRAMPLCCVRPGIEGCHAAFDQYRLLPGGRAAHIEAGKRWSAETRTTINNLGLWPANLPQWQEGEDDGPR